MSENPLVHALTQSIQAAGLGDALKLLNSCHSVLSTHPSPHTLIDLKVTTLLNRLNSKYSSQIYSALSRLYLAIAKSSEKSEVPVLIKLCNDILMLSENIKYSEISEELNSSVQNLLQLLLSTELEVAQKEVVNSLLQKKETQNFEEKFKAIVQAIEENRISGMHELFDLFSNFESFKEQIEMFSTKLDPVLSALRKLNNAELIRKLLIFLEQFVFRFNYSVQFGEFTEIYVLSQSKKLDRCIVPTVVDILSIILAYDISITQGILPILQRLWALFPQETESMYTVISLTLSSIASQGSSEFKFKAASFLYEVLNTPGFPQRFKDLLEASDHIRLLINDEGFSPSSQVLETENTLKIEDLQPVSGFPLNAMIAAGEEFFYTVEILEANSILTWGFATEYYDVNFELLRIDLPTPQIVVKHEKVLCSEAPFTGSKLISSPGLYKFVWTNKHSWFTSKHIRFRISILVPYHKINYTEKDLHSVIEVINPESFSVNDTDVLEVSIICKNKIVILSAKGIAEEIPDLDILAINSFIQRVKGEKRYNGVRIGIIAKVPKKKNELRQLKSVAICRDVDAIALLNESEMHYNTLVCVMCEEGLRSCVLYRGKIMVDGSGTPIGDLNRAAISDIFVGVSTLLCLFGPAVVVVCGSDAPTIENINERVKDLVPKHIMQESLVKTSAYGNQAPVIAASKLHYLNHKYRINQ